MHEKAKTTFKSYHSGEGRSNMSKVVNHLHIYDNNIKTYPDLKHGGLWLSQLMKWRFACGHLYDGAPQ